MLIVGKEPYNDGEEVPFNSVDVRPSFRRCVKTRFSVCY